MVLEKIYKKFLKNEDFRKLLMFLSKESSLKEEVAEAGEQALVSV